jgi:hypothetical protein
MMRFFFDYKGQDQTILDYRGEDFENSQSAVDFAKAIAQDMEHSLSTNWDGWRVEIRRVDGKTLYSLTVGTAEQRAA